MHSPEVVAVTFIDRVDAGRRLARVLSAYREDPEAVVLGVPRGGVVVAAQVARELGLPLDVVVASKVGAPGNPEYAVGAVAPDGVVTTGERELYTAEELATLAGPTHEKIARRLEAFRRGRPAVEIAGRTAIVVDDGIATGLTARAAVEYLRRQGAARIVVAVPVMPPDAKRALAPAADDVIALETPMAFWAVGQFYRVFDQTEDAEVVRLLDEARERASG
jgi:putative phosphoribosyl transferase